MLKIGHFIFILSALWKFGITLQLKLLNPVNYVHGAESFLRSGQFRSYSRISQHSTEPESSLPCSQKPSTGSYLEPDKPSPYHPILFSKIHFNIILPLTSTFLSGFFPSGYPTKTWIHSSSLSFVLHSLPILSLLTSLQSHLAKSTTYESPHYAVFSSLLLFNSSSVQIFSSAYDSETPSVYVLPLISETKIHTHTKLYAKL
jgi:hypothetical protein